MVRHGRDCNKKPQRKPAGLFYGFKISRRLFVRRRKLKFAVQRRYVFRVRFHIKAARKKTVAVNTIAAPEAMLR